MTVDHPSLFYECACCGNLLSERHKTCTRCGQGSLLDGVVAVKPRKAPLPHETGAPLISYEYDGVITV